MAYDPQAHYAEMTASIYQRWVMKQLGHLPEADLPPEDSFEAKWWELLDSLEGLRERVLAQVEAVLNRG